MLTCSRASRPGVCLCECVSVHLLPSPHSWIGVFSSAGALQLHTYDDRWTFTTLARYLEIHISCWLARTVCNEHTYTHTYTLALTRWIWINAFDYSNLGSVGRIEHALRHSINFITRTLISPAQGPSILRKCKPNQQKNRPVNTS